MKIVKRILGIIWGICVVISFSLIIIENDPFWINLTKTIVTLAAFFNVLFFVSVSSFLSNKEDLIDFDKKCNISDRSSFWHNSHIIFCSISTLISFALESYWLGAMMFIIVIGHSFEKNLVELIKKYKETAPNEEH